MIKAHTGSPSPAFSRAFAGSDGGCGDAGGGCIGDGEGGGDKGEGGGGEGEGGGGEGEGGGGEVEAMEVEARAAAAGRWRGRWWREGAARVVAVTAAVDRWIHR